MTGPVKVLGRIVAPDETVRDVEAEAWSHGTAKLRVTSSLRPDERLLFIRLVHG